MNRKGPISSWYVWNRAVRLVSTSRICLLSSTILSPTDFPTSFIWSQEIYKTRFIHRTLRPNPTGICPEHNTRFQRKAFCLWSPWHRGFNFHGVRCWTSGTQIPWTCPVRIPGKWERKSWKRHEGDCTSQWPKGHFRMRIRPSERECRDSLRNLCGWESSVSQGSSSGTLRARGRSRGGEREVEVEWRDTVHHGY